MGLSKRRRVECAASQLWYAIVIVILIIAAALFYVYAPGKQVTTTITQTLVKTVRSIETATITKTITYTSVATETATAVVTQTSVATVTKTAIKTVTIEKKFPVTVIDALGRAITIEKPPQHVVSLAPSITEILFALGLGNRIVGVDSYSNYPPEVKELEEKGRIRVVGSYWNPDIEKILSLRPDLVIADVGAHARLKATFESYGLRVLYVHGGSAKSLKDVYSDIQLIATVFGIEDRGAKLAASISSAIDAIKENLSKANATRVKVFLLLSPPAYGFWTTGSGTYLNELIQLAGGINVFSDKYGWIQVSREEILKRDPQVIIVCLMGSKEDAKKVFEQIVNDDALSKTRAVKEKRIYIVTGDADDLLMRPGPRVAKALRLLAQMLHPDVFGEVSRSDVYTAKSFEAEFAIPVIEAPKSCLVEA